MKLFAFLMSLLMIGTAFGLSYNISVPEAVETGNWFYVNVSMISEKDLNLTTYSYVFNGLDCVGQGWTMNQKNISLIAGEPTDIVLQDLVKRGTESGFYKLRIKLNFDNESINETFMVKVNASKGIEPTYLYIGLVLISIAGLYLVLKKG